MGLSSRPEQPGRFDIAPADLERFFRVADDGKPALVFAAHLANWELPAISAAAYGVDSAVLYRGRTSRRVDRWLTETRAASMGTLIPTGLDAPVKLAEALERGAHVGMLVDQYYVRGVAVTFFGRRTRANPLLARLARHFDCPIHGVRVVRLPGHRFRGEMTEAIQAGARRRGQDRHRRHHADRHRRDRRLDPRTSRAVAVAAPPLAAGR